MALSVPPKPVLRQRLRVAPPFRLDLTVAALRRLPTNRVDVFDGDRYLRAFATPRGPVVWEVRLGDEEHLEVALHGAVDDDARYLELLDRMLAPRFDLGPFYARAAAGPAPLARLVERFQGMKPPRTCSLWETFVNTIPFQQLSLKSAMTVLARLIESTGEPVEFGGRILHPLPDPGRFLRLGDGAIRSVGLSGAKARALREAAEAVHAGAVDEASLEALDTGALAKKLQSFRGVGPWTAELMLLRGFRRLETFPAGDAGATAGLRAVFPGVDAARLLDELGPYRGMLYYHLLLARGLSH
jgi:DNA-3-methyladenine glycosylase II